jgi:hypothetical protein
VELPNDDRWDQWWTWYRWVESKYSTPLSITFAEVATHNHFVLDRGGKVFKQTAPVIKLPAGATEDDHLGLLGLLNSSVACFWLHQVCRNKGGPGGNAINLVGERCVTARARSADGRWTSLRARCTGACDRVVTRPVSNNIF